MPLAIVPNSLLVDRGKIGELGRCQTVLAEIVIKKHARKVTRLVTGVNGLMTDSDKHFVYSGGMKHPNRLAELMDREGVNDPTLAAAAKPETTKQQIFKLRQGQSKLTREWAERLERSGLLNASWPEIMGWRNPSSLVKPETQKMLQVIGIRIGWARALYRKIDPLEAAARFGMSPERLHNIESGTEIITVPEVVEISTKLEVELAFLLQGRIDDLPHKAALEWEAYRQGLLSSSPSHKG